MVGSGLAQPRPSARFVEVVHSLDGLWDDWHRLAAASRNVFATYEWSETWWRHFGRNRRLVLGLWRGHADEPVAIVPLYRWSRQPVRIVRFVGHGHGDFLGPICAEGNLHGGMHALQSTLAHEPHDVFLGEWVRADANWHTAMGATSLRRTGYPILRLDGASWEDVLARRSPSSRKEARRQLRRLERDHDVRFRRTESRQTLARDLDVVYALHRERFGSHDPCFFCKGRSEAFHRDFAATALDRGWLRLWILEVDGVPVAAEYGFWYGDAHFAYQSGRATSWRDASVGFVLQAHTIREAIADGAAEYRFLEGNEGYKYGFATEDPGLATIGVGRTARGHAAVAAVQALGRLGRARTIVRRLAGIGAPLGLRLAELLGG